MNNPAGFQAGHARHQHIHEYNIDHVLFTSPHRPLAGSRHMNHLERTVLRNHYIQRFAHKYAIAVLMANARSGSALWDEKGQLIVRADKGELLLTGSLGRQGWQGDIIPLG